MARTLAELPKGARITDYISLGVVSKTFPLSTITTILRRMGKASKRQRELPAHVVIYYVIALAFFMQASYREILRCLLEGLQWLKRPGEKIHVTGKSGISQARTRMGWEPIKALHDEIVGPIAKEKTKGAWFRNWRLVSLDGSTLDVADTRENREAYGYPGASRGKSAYPQIRFVSLVENGTHVLEGVPDSEPFYRLITTIIDHEKAPAHELAALFGERWEIETALDELKTHLRGSQIVLRSKTHELVKQEFYGLMLAHYAIRGLMHEAALKDNADPETVSFIHTVRVIRRKLPLFVSFPPSEKSDAS